jgi:hypothetical protein
MKNLATALTLLFILAGCASASLEVQSDIYKETPLAEKERQEDRLVDVAANIAKMKAFAPAIAEARKELAQQVIDIYAAFLVIVAANEGLENPVKIASDERIRLAEPLPEFDDALDQAVEKVSLDADAAQVALGDYLAVLFDPIATGQVHREQIFQARTNYTVKADALKASFDLSLKSGGDTTYASVVSFLKDWVPVSLSQVDSDQADLLAQQLTEASNTAAELVALGVATAKMLPTDLANAAASAQGRSVQGLQNTVPAAVRELTTLVIDGGEAPPPDILIRDIAAAQTFYNSQIDRLQDPADPAWLEVIDPENEPNWVPFFARTKFRAEGNAEVIVVRDRPGHYRVQRGINNPAALIQGQLEISRSIASGVTAILGAVSGVQVPVLGQPAQSGTATAVTSGPQSETLSQQEARVDAVQRLRISSRNSVISELSLLTRELNSLPAGDTQRRDAIYARGSTILKSYSELLKFTGGI